MGRILAIDFGKKRTGLAVTDPLQIIASGLETVDSNELIGYLKKYFAAEQVDKVLIGYPPIGMIHQLTPLLWWINS